MDILEPLWFTISTVHEIVKSHKELAYEISELGETVKLITIALKPLNSVSKQDDIEEVMAPVRQVLLEANKLLMQITEEKKTSKQFLIFNLFRPQNYLEEIRGYHEKLKTLTPILTLAINSLQHKKSTDHHHSLDQMGGSSFSASKIIKHESAKQFWVQHFGEQVTCALGDHLPCQLYKVDWSRFLSAFEHHYSDLIKEKQVDFGVYKRALKSKLDKNNDGQIDVYEWDNFTNVNGAFESFITFVNGTSPISDSDTQANKKRKNNSDESGTEDIHQIKKPKEEESLSDSELMPPPQPLYRLVLFGNEDLISAEGFADLSVIQRSWHAEPFSIGRTFFAEIPSELLVRISRQHFEISCVLNSAQEKEFWITDLSGNGTYLNGKLLGKSNKAQLHDNDEIGVLMQKPQLKNVEIGYPLLTSKKLTE